MRRLHVLTLALILAAAGFAEPRLSLVAAAWADDDDDDGGGGWSGGRDDDDDGFPQRRFPQSSPVYRPAPAPVYRPAPAPAYRPAPAPLHQPAAAAPRYQPAPALRVQTPLHQPVAPFRGGFDDDDDDDGGGPVYQPAPRFQPAPPPPTVAAPPPENRPEILTLNLSPADLAALLAQGFSLIEAQEVAGLSITLRRLAPPPGLPLAQARDAVRALPSGAEADFNHFYRTEQAGFAPPCRGDHCRAFAQVGWPAQVSRSASCGAELRIGVIDTGINAAHEAFIGARLLVHDLSDPAERDSAEMHGTSVAALLVGAPEGRTPGLTPDLPIVAVDVFHRAGSDERADAFAIIRALGLLAEEGARVVNMSLAGPPNAVLEDALARLTTERRMVFVAAAGNAGPHAPPAYPAAYPTVIAVTAVDGSDNVYRRAGQGPHIDLAAPGVELWTAASIRGGRPKSGTSFAAPFVSAAAARLLQRDPGLSPQQTAAALAGSARDLGAPGRDPVFGYGLLQMAAENECAAAPFPRR